MFDLGLYNWIKLYLTALSQGKVFFMQENRWLYIRSVRDWSLITGKGGGATKREGGGACEVLPL